MKYFYLLLISILILGNACRKVHHGENSHYDAPPGAINPNQSASIAAASYNPIVGKWELGTFKILCPGATDTTIYPNERGDFVEFRKTDTAFYTYNTTNATGWSPYIILDSTRFILGDTLTFSQSD